ncbi:S-norcoclaurine synthase 1 [Ziziphus jujuba]|uniref:S-norcoclaurine synthase 1 n=1 Tax=Ziziphus jujuba TaxID=326968 RepID=A0A6P4AZ94_ZIZJJ|nr:S-norcoclaurine synthase 1 [Ziziphus jujuba]
MRRSELLEFRTPQHPSLGTNNWGGASPLLARNIPEESLEQIYRRLNSIRTKDEIFPTNVDDYNYYHVAQSHAEKHKCPPTPNRNRGLLWKFLSPKKEKLELGSKTRFNDLQKCIAVDQSCGSREATGQYVIGSYSAEVRKLGLYLLDLICEGLGLESLEGEVHGLLVFKDEKWFAIEPPHSFVVNIGHMLQVISNGKLRSADHRVVTNKRSARKTVTSFNPSLQ